MMIIHLVLLYLVVTIADIIYRLGTREVAARLLSVKGNRNADVTYHRCSLEQHASTI